MAIIGFLSLAAAAVALYICLRQRRTLEAARGTETLTCGQINELSGAGGDARLGR